LSLARSLGGSSTQSEPWTAAAGSLLPRHKASAPVGEMDNLPELHVASVLTNLESLFHQEQPSHPHSGKCNTIYSSVGPVLIAMNPFAELPVYGKEWMEAYQKADVGAPLPPHCYRTAAEAFQGLRRRGHQAVVICGESGAGKTVTNRKMLEYLCAVGAPKSGQSGANPIAITNSNVLLEAFGNAKTMRNDNSSRFGKLTKLHFNPSSSYEVASCDVDHYLLERSRIVGQPSGERNYHIFYQLLKSGRAEEFGLTGNAQTYWYTLQGGDSEIPGVDDKADFDVLCDCMKSAGMSPDTIKFILETVAGVLLLGAVDFNGDEDRSSLDTSCQESVDQACKLLGVDPEEMIQALRSTYVKAAGQKPIRKEVGQPLAVANRDTVAKTIYARLFDFIVAVISRTLQPPRSRGGSIRGAPQADAVVSLLDIFGFEDMNENGFEQLFINLTNERIQSLFNRIMFERELEEYRREGITAAFDPGRGNAECVDLFCLSKPPGVIKLLADQCQTGKDGAAFVSVLNGRFGNHPYFSVADPRGIQQVMKAKGLASKAAGRMKTQKGATRMTTKKFKKDLSLDYRECFGIRHYAGVVVYTVRDFVTKSRDALLPHLAEVLRKSSKPNLQSLFADDSEDAKGTVGEKFVGQLEKLADDLQQGETLFVRCIKSNMQQIPLHVDRKMVLEQLTRGGVVAALEMRHAGLPDRLEYRTFAEEFDLLDWSSRRAANVDGRVVTEAVLRSIIGGEHQGVLFAFGYNKVFMKSGVLSRLRAVMLLYTKQIVRKVQSRWRAFKGTKLVHRVTETWLTVTAAIAEAKATGVWSVAAISAALEEQQGQVKPWWESIQGLDVKSAVTKLEPLVKDTTFSKLVSRIEATAKQVKSVASRKTSADAAYSSSIQQGLADVHDMLAEISRIEEDTEGVVDTDGGKQRCEEACAAARKRLEELRITALPDLKNQGPTYDLLADGPIEVDSGAVDALIASVSGLVDNARKCGHEITVTRREFQKAIAESSQQRAEASARLDALKKDAQRCMTEGIDGVMDCVNAASELEGQLDDLMEEASDAAAFLATVKELSEAVAAAAAAISKAKAELEKREQERTERTALGSRLDDLAERVAEGLRSLRLRPAVQLESKDTDLAGELTAVSAEVAELRGQLALPLDALRTKVSAAAARADKVVEALEASAQDEFSRRRAMFGGGARVSSALDHPEEFIRQEGVQDHEDVLMRIYAGVKELQEAKAQRSRVKRCLDHFVKHAFAGDSAFDPPGRA